MSEQTENREVFIGVDVSKSTLDVKVRPTGQQWQFSNDDKGRRDALNALLPLEPTLIVTCAEPVEAWKRPVAWKCPWPWN